MGLVGTGLAWSLSDPKYWPGLIFEPEPGPRPDPIWTRSRSGCAGEMIEAVGHEYMDEFFGCCESLLANGGLLVLQVVFSRPGNVTAFTDPYQSWPSAC
ncbi:unnamed protein product [Lupinus luteus]|uniref:Uncharacterized protein n=1 Tax=Lupinus luteus TaxID=3873 RepID=A0AAV1X6K1_LUPLU